MVMKVSQKVTAAQEWKQRMRTARHSLPDVVGQQMVLKRVVETNPELDTLTNMTRWKNAWGTKVADPNITKAVEAAAQHFNDLYNPVEKRLQKQGLQRPDR